MQTYELVMKAFHIFKHNIDLFPKWIFFLDPRRGKVRRPKENLETSDYPLTPMHKKLIKIEYIKAQHEEERCMTQGCDYKKIWCPLPCGEFGLCEKCSTSQTDNICPCCRKVPDEWIKIYDVQ